MLPPGRRRLSPFSSPSAFNFLAFFILFILSTPAGANAILGIDLGTSFIKAVLVKPGAPLDIVLTRDSKRKEAAAIAFKPARTSNSDADSLEEVALPERLYGADALVLAARFPSDVYPNLKPLLGALGPDSLAAKDYASRHPAVTIGTHADRGTVTLSGDAAAAAAPKAANSEKQLVGGEFLVEELLAMELKNVVANAESMAGPIRDVVITIPGFFTASERRAVEFAAELAGLRVLGLISDGLAVGVNYATSRTFPNVNEGGKPEHHLVFDMGAGSTSATVIRFQGRTVKDVGRFNKTVQEVSVLGMGWDQTLGGDAMTKVVMDNIVEAFAASPKVKKMGLDETAAEAVTGNGRTAAKLWKEAERIRQVLSANSETVASFESLYKDIDYKYKISRTEFEELTASFSSRVSAPIIDAVKAAKLEFGDLESVILHGGAARTPFVQRELEKLLGGSEKVRTNVNADEAAVFGAAFHGAGLSPSFRVREIRAIDAAGFAAGIKWDAEDKARSQKLFQPTSHTGADKSVPIKKLTDFSFMLYQLLPDGENPEITFESPIVEVKTQNLTVSVEKLETLGCKKAEIVTKFLIRLSSIDGLPEVAHGSVSCEVDTSVDKKSGVVEDVKGFFGFGGKKSEQEPLKSEEDIDAISSTLEAENTPTLAAEESSSKSQEIKKEKKPKKKLEIIYIDLVRTPQGLSEPSETELANVRSRLQAYEQSDSHRKRREESRNTLEGLTYKYRDVMTSESFIEASIQEERGRLDALLSDLGEWLYGDGADATQGTLDEKLSILKGIVDPIENRRKEALERPGQVKALKEALEKAKEIVNLIRTQAEAAAEASKSISEEQTALSTPESLSTTTPDGLDELEDSTSTSTTASSKPSKPPGLPEFDLKDVEAVTKQYDAIQEWFAEKLKEQNELKPFENPVLLTADLQNKVREASRIGMDLIMRRARVPPKGGKKRPSKPNSKKSKKDSDTSSTATNESLDEDILETQTSPGEDVTKTSTQSESKTTSTASATKKKKAKASSSGKKRKGKKPSIEEVQEALKKAEASKKSKAHDEL